MNFIQEVLSLLDRKQDKKNLDINRDYFEFGRTKPSNVGNPLYSPKMTPHAIKYKDFKCETIKGLISGTGTEHTLPVWSELDPDNCNIQTVIDSVYSQDAAAQTGTVAANLTVNGNLLVLGTQTVIESTIVEIADNIIELNTLGADVNSGFSVGTVNGLKTFGWDSTNLLWNTFKENLMTQNIIVKKNIKINGESINLVTNSVEGLASEPFDNAIPTTLAVINYVNENIGGSDYQIFPFDSQTNPFAFIGLTKDGVQDTVFKVLGDQWIKPSSNGTDLIIEHATPGISTTSGDVELSNGSTFVVKNHNYDAAGHIISEEDVSYKLAIQGLASPVMTSAVTGTGKLWDDAIQAVPAVAVSAIDDRTYGVQFNDAKQLVVNVPWVEGSGGGITGGGTTNYMTMWTGNTSIGDAPMKMRQSVTGGVNILTLGEDTDGDNVTFEATVEFQGGVKDSGSTLGTAGQVLKSIASGAVRWEDLASAVTSVDFTSDIAGFSATVVNGTTTPSISLNLNGGTAGQFLRQDGLWATIPGGNVGTVTSFSASLVNGDSLSVAVADSTSTPSANFTWGGAASEYVNGEGDLQPFPTIPAVPFTSLTTTGTTGLSTLAAGVLNIPNYANTQNTLTTTGSGAATLTGTVLNIPTPVIPAVPFTSLTTTGVSGAATLTSGVLNIPEYASEGTTNCTFGNTIITDNKALSTSFIAIQSSGSVLLGYENTSGVTKSYVNTISLTFETRDVRLKSYDVEVRFEARVAAGVVVLHTYEDSFYSENDKKVTKTYTYYSPNLENAGLIYVSARSLTVSDVAITTAHIAVVSSSCDASNDGTMKVVTLQPLPNDTV